MRLLQIGVRVRQRTTGACVREACHRTARTVYRDRGDSWRVHFRAHRRDAPGSIPWPRSPPTARTTLAPASWSSRCSTVQGAPLRQAGRGRRRRVTFGITRWLLRRSRASSVSIGRGRASNRTGSSAVLTKRGSITRWAAPARVARSGRTSTGSHTNRWHRRRLRWRQQTCSQSCRRTRPCRHEQRWSRLTATAPSSRAAPARNRRRPCRSIGRLGGRCFTLLLRLVPARQVA